MRMQAPEGFSAAHFFSDVHVFQTWDIFPGQETQGQKPVKATLDHLNMPARLDGRRVLEIAPWNGFFTFEMLRRGAREVVALGPDNPTVTGFDKTAKILEVEDQITYVRDSIYNIARHSLGTFDVVVCLGLLYHLRHPLLAMDLLHDHCNMGGFTYIDTAVCDEYAFIEPPGSTNEDKAAWDRLIKKIPLEVLVRGSEMPIPLARDPFNWYIPTASCVRAWARSSGFRIEFETAEQTWTWLQLVKEKRPFVDGLEGYNAVEQGGC